MRPIELWPGRLQLLTQAVQAPNHQQPPYKPLSSLNHPCNDPLPFPLCVCGVWEFWPEL